MGDPLDHDASTTLVGAKLGGKYQLLRMLGEGGMGQVYEATNTNTGRRVAIKTLHSYLMGNASLRQRFLQEARAATQIEHPNVIEVLDLDIDQALGIPYIVQEFLSGETLADRLDAAPAHRFSPEEALRIAVPVMGALVAAHNLGIVHRDLKPENIFLVRDRSGAEAPKVIDFGIAKVIASSEATSNTRTGTTLGTPAYMSPEQAMGLTATIDAQSDVWAMGVVLYQMLSGRLPYEAENAALTLGMIQYRAPVPLADRDPTLSADLVALVGRALTRERSGRFATMQAFLGELLDASAGAGAGACCSAQSPTAPDGTPASWSLQPTQPAVTAPDLLPTVAETTIAEARPATIQDGWTANSSGSSARRLRLKVTLVATSLLTLAAVAAVVLSHGNSAQQVTAPPRTGPPTTVTSRPAQPPAPTVVVHNTNNPTTADAATVTPTIPPGAHPPPITHPVATHITTTHTTPRALTSRPQRTQQQHQGPLNPDRDWHP